MLTKKAAVQFIMLSNRTMEWNKMSCDCPSEVNNISSMFPMTAPPSFLTTAVLIRIQAGRENKSGPATVWHHFYWAQQTPRHEKASQMHCGRRFRVLTLLTRNNILISVKLFTAISTVCLHILSKSIKLLIKLLLQVISVLVTTKQAAAQQ